MSVNLVRFENLQQVLKIIEPSFNELAKIHGAVDYRKEASFAIQALNDNPYLTKVAMQNQDSLKRAVVNVAAIGLSLNPVLKLAYLIPRKNKVCLDVSYIGLIALAVEGKSIEWATAEIVCEKDDFKCSMGEKPVHNYSPFDNERGKIVGAYCVAKTCSGEFITTTMSIDEIYKIRNRSESWQAGKSSPWKTDEGEMIKKTVIRRGSKSWPRASTYHRMDVATEVLNESDELSAPVIVDNFKRAEQFTMIRKCLDLLNIDEDYYINETLCKITRRKITMFEELTDLEIDQITVQLSQMVEEMPNENA